MSYRRHKFITSARYKSQKYKSDPHVIVHGANIRMLNRKEIRDWAVRLRQIMSGEPVKKPMHFDEWGKV